MTLPPRGFLFYSVLCGLLACLPFLPGLPGGFVFDDAFNILENSGLQLESLQPAALMDAAFSAQFGGTTRVLPTLTFALDYFRGNGFDPGTFKVTNIAIHALTTLVIAWFLRTLLQVIGLSAARAHWGALAMALTWAVHPMHVSSVLYVVQRMQTLATLFMLLALWSYLKARQAQLHGRSGRSGLLLSGLLWAVAFGCKEDAIAFPLYTLALELTVLRFRAENPSLARNLRRGYTLSIVVGAAMFLFVVMPHFWSWDSYPLREFSTTERLMSQGRVLCMYLWEILLPLPSHMPFYYDWLQPSRGLLQPWTTLTSLVLIFALLGTAWRMRHCRPLFALGVFLFFAGHFVTSNVIGLELAFEHRNHFPLVGVVLAACDLLVLIFSRLKLGPKPYLSAYVLLLAALTSATVVRARSWDSSLKLAETSTKLAPTSVRAWNSLCVAWFDLGGGAKKDNPHLGKAIDACSRAADVSTDSIKSLTNIIAFKTIQGTIVEADWQRYLEGLRHGPMTPDNASSIWVILNRARDGMPVDGDRMFEAIEIINQRAPFRPIEAAAVGYFILGHTQQPAKAYPYFERAVQTTLDPSFADGLIADLLKEGYPEWASRLEALPRKQEQSGDPGKE